MLDDLSLAVCDAVYDDCRSPEAGGASVQSLSLSDSHLAELDGDTLRLFGLGALEALERGWGAQTAGAVTVIAFRYIPFDAIAPTLPRIRVKFPNLSVRSQPIVHSDSPALGHCGPGLGGVPSRCCLCS